MNILHKFIKNNFILVKYIIIISVIFIVIHYGLLINYDQFDKYLNQSPLFILLYILSWVLFAIPIYIINFRS